MSRLCDTSNHSNFCSKLFTCPVIRLRLAKKCCRGDTRVDASNKRPVKAFQSKRVVTRLGRSNRTDSIWPVKVQIVFSRNQQKLSQIPESEAEKTKYSNWRTHQAQQKLTQLTEFHIQMTLSSGGYQALQGLYQIPECHQATSWRDQAQQRLYQIPESHKDTKSALLERPPSSAGIKPDT